MTQGKKQLRTKQKMRNPEGFVRVAFPAPLYINICAKPPNSNINVFGLAFIATFSVVVTLLDLFLLKLIIYTNKLRHPRIDRWVQDSTLQLQRRAYEAHGEGS